MHIIQNGYYMKVPKGNFKSAEDANRKLAKKYVCDWSYWSYDYFEARYKDNKTHDIYFYKCDGHLYYTLDNGSSVTDRYKPMQDLGELL